MRLAILQTREFGSINLRLTQWESKLYIECRDANRFLAHLTQKEISSELPSSAWIRGVITPGGGAVFEVFDQFGSLGAITSISDESIGSKILDLLIWQV